jgi:hypothetical protein
MSVVDICVLASVLVVVLIVAKMLRAVRLLDGRVTLLQEQVKLGHAAASRSRDSLPAMPRPSSGKTPFYGVPVLPPTAPRTPAPQVLVDNPAADSPFPGEAAAHYIDESEAEAVWTRMEAEQERLRKAMGRDFRVRTAAIKIDPSRSAAAVRGRPTEIGGQPSEVSGLPPTAPGKPAVRALSAQELAKKLTRR